jgi:hypothetical protein
MRRNERSVSNADGLGENSVGIGFAEFEVWQGYFSVFMAGAKCSFETARGLFLPPAEATRTIVFLAVL